MKYLLIIFLTTAASNASTCPPIYEEGQPNHFSAVQYAEHRDLCTMKCNEDDRCCTKDAGGCQTVPCTVGCHVAWFSQDLDECKAKCDEANSAGCFWEWHHKEVFGYGLSYNKDFAKPGVNKCAGAEYCGCSSNDFGHDCAPNYGSCAKGCDFANEMKDLFFHGPNVTIDPRQGLDPNKLEEATTALAEHIKGNNPMSGNEITNQARQFLENAALVTTTMPLITNALDLVDSYETYIGPLFINSQTKGGFNREGQEDGLELARGMIAIHQAIFEFVFKYSELYPDLLSSCSDFLRGRSWKTSSYFPGPVTFPVNPTEVHKVSINATNHAYWGRMVSFANEPTRRPTGLYLAPGGVGVLTVPSNLVNKGFEVLVGANTIDNVQKAQHRRMDRVTNSFPIKTTTINIANPLGGGIFIIIPYLSDLGLVDVSVSGDVVKSPFFSKTSHHKTTDEEWKEQTSLTAPWADFETDKFMLSVPTSWIYGYNYAHFEALLIDYDLAMEGVREMGGYEAGTENKHVLYIQPDLHIQHGAYGIGYPQVNQNIQCNDDGPIGNGQSSHWMVTDANGWSVTYHELGHAQLQTMYRGETEASNNFYRAYILNVKFGEDFNYAFANSMNFLPYLTPDQAAIHWMVTENFRDGKDMDHSNTEHDEFRYQHRGYAKYADIVRLYGWDTLVKFNHQQNLNCINENECIGGFQGVDDRTLKLSIAAGYDLTPLIHFWGIQPEDPESLKENMLELGLGPSFSLEEFLLNYKTLIPVTNADFNDIYETFFPGKPEGGSPLYGPGWFNAWKDRWNEYHGWAAQTALQNIIDLYF